MKAKKTILAVFILAAVADFMSLNVLAMFKPNMYDYEINGVYRLWGWWAMAGVYVAAHVFLAWYVIKPFYKTRIANQVMSSIISLTILAHVVGVISNVHGFIVIETLTPPSELETWQVQVILTVILIFAMWTSYGAFLISNRLDDIHKFEKHDKESMFWIPLMKIAGRLYRRTVK